MSLNIKINPMSETEYNIWAPRCLSSYAADKMRTHTLSQTTAEQIAQDDFKRLLPNGLRSDNNFLFSAKDESENLVGFIWYCIHKTKGRREAFVYDIIVEEQYRNKGYGKQMMLFAEANVKNSGVNKIGLHVFGFNQTAIRLYKSLNYEITDLIMEKTL